MIDTVRRGQWRCGKACLRAQAPSSAGEPGRSAAHGPGRVPAAWQRHCHRGSVFLMILMMLAIMTIAATGFLMTAQAGRETAHALNHLNLARQAARNGTDHAIAVLRSEFLTTPGVPTHLAQHWRRDFASIDGDDDNSNLAAANNWDENDLKPDDLSWFPLTGWWRNEAASAVSGINDPRYNYNSQAITQHNGRARWYEPGWRHSDASKVVSFNKQPAENTPDIQDPLYLDSQWRALALDPSDSTRDTWPELRALARYRLRYAVSIQDLSGHLLSHLPGAYWTGSGGGTVIPWTGVSWVPDELDNDPVQNPAGTVAIAQGRPYRASMYAPVFYDMGVILGLRPGGDGRQIARSFAGYGSGFGAVTIASSTMGTFAFKGFDTSGIPLDMNGFQLTTANGYGNIGYLAQAGIGPAFSWDQLRVMHDRGQSHIAQFALTPFGRPHDPAAADKTMWYWGPSDSPWRVNILTAPMGIVRAMVYGYLPGEAKIYNGTLRKRLWSGRSQSGNDEYNTVVSDAPNTEAYLAWDRRSLAWPLAGGSAQWNAAAGNWESSAAGQTPDPYPGDPNQPVTGWANNLGGFCTVNRLGDGQIGTINAGLPIDDLGDAANSKPQPRDPMTGSSPWFHYNDEIIVLQEGQNEDRNGDGIRGQQWRLSPPDYRLSAFTNEGGYINHNSYFLDIAMALLHTVGDVRTAWQDVSPADGTPDQAALYDTMDEIDQAFVEAMGERWTSVAPHDPVAGTGRFSKRGGFWGPTGWVSKNEFVDIDLGRAPISSRTIFGSGLTTDQMNLLELVLNDARMSFFGASPSYCNLDGTPRFAPLDFSHDGKVYCSAYRDPATPSDITAAGAWMNWQQAPAVAGDYRGPVPAWNRLRSATGTFALQKSRFWRILSRGQVWDERFGRVVSESNQQTVYAVDPDGSVFDRTDQFIGGQTAATTSGLDDSIILFQKWLTNRNLSSKLQTYP